MTEEALDYLDTNGESVKLLPNNNVYVGGADGEDSQGSAESSSANSQDSECATLCEEGLPPAVVRDEGDNNGETDTKRVRGDERASSSSSGRGRPKKALVPMYHSQISGDKDAIKIRIRKSSLDNHVQLTSNQKKTGRRKKHKNDDDSDHEGGKKSRTAETRFQPPTQQTDWGLRLPANVLYDIFRLAMGAAGAVPTLVRLGKVCKLWRDVAVSPSLWRKVNLYHVRSKWRNDMKLHWLAANRLTDCRDLNLGEWKVRNIQPALEALCTNCPELRGLNLSGWKGLNADNIKYITTEFEKLQRLDLSSINSTAALNAQPLISLGQSMNSRLTHFVLAHNKVAGFTQVIISLASNCPNLELLDISNIRTFAHSTALLHVEKMQVGCSKLRVLRITGSQVWLAPATIQEQIASPGFPCLEELSLAGMTGDATTTARCVNDDDIARILKNSTKLRLLDVRGCILLTDSGLVKVPAWDLEHLYLSACYITRTQNAGLELILQKWRHSLLEVDLAWTTDTDSLYAAVLALADKGPESPLRVINLCGSSINLESVKSLLAACPNLHSLNLQSCRALPRGFKRLYIDAEIAELRRSLRERPAGDDHRPPDAGGGGGGAPF